MENDEEIRTRTVDPKKQPHQSLDHKHRQVLFHYVYKSMQWAPPPPLPRFILGKVGFALFFSFFSKHRSWVLVRTAPNGAVLASTYNLCLEHLIHTISRSIKHCINNIDKFR